MHITMVKKRLADGSECRKCQEASSMLESKGLWNRVDEVVWAHEADPQSPGMVLGTKLGVGQAPFFVVRDDAGGGEQVYTSVLQLMRERLRQDVSAVQQAVTIDADDIGGI
jgi:hypothetical protein